MKLKLSMEIKKLLFQSFVGPCKNFRDFPCCGQGIKLLFYYLGFLRGREIWFMINLSRV